MQINSGRGGFFYFVSELLQITLYKVNFLCGTHALIYYDCVDCFTIIQLWVVCTPKQ